MRNRPLRRLKIPAVLGLLVALSSPTSAQTDGPPREQDAVVHITLEPPASLVAGDRAEVIASVRIEPTTDAPVLVTPSTEGSAIDVVRGRFLRADAEDPTAEELRFRIPIVARARGTSVLGVRISTWVCNRQCKHVTGDGSVTLRVARGEG